jgi:hypothetical protein
MKPYERSELGVVGEGFDGEAVLPIPLSAATRQQAAKSRFSPLKERGRII